VQSPSKEWTVIVGSFAFQFAALDWMRSRGDADFDTFSECVRAGVAKIPHGEVVLAALLAAPAVGFWHHICKPLHQ
jgi:hypothetical protein